MTLEEVLSQTQPTESQPKSYTVSGYDQGGSFEYNFTKKAAAKAAKTDFENRGANGVRITENNTYTDGTFTDQEQVAGLTVEEQFDEDAKSFLGDLPLSGLNIEAGPVENRGYSSAKPKSKGGRNPMNATYPAGGIGRLATQVASALVKKLRLKKSVSILGVKELAQMSEAKFNEMFTDPRVAAAVREQMNALLDNTTALGRYMGFNDAHVILVDNRSDNQLQTALTTAHELGHALIQEEMAGSLENSALYRRLVNDFEKARAAKDAPAAYQDPNNELAFEEWYSDQVREEHIPETNTAC